MKDSDSHENRRHLQNTLHFFEHYVCALACWCILLSETPTGKSSGERDTKKIKEMNHKSPNRSLNVILTLQPMAHWNKKYPLFCKTNAKSLHNNKTNHLQKIYRLYDYADTSLNMVGLFEYSRPMLLLERSLLFKDSPLSLSKATTVADSPPPAAQGSLGYRDIYEHRCRLWDNP